MLIPTKRLWTAALPDVPINHLLLSLARSQTLFWVVGENKFGAMLTGDYAGHGFLIEEAANWSGVAIGPVELRLDPSSAHDEEIGGWNVRAADGHLSLSTLARSSHGFDERTWVKVAPMRTAEGKTTYFSAWSLGMPAEVGEWLEMVSVKGGKVATLLLGP